MQLKYLLKVAIGLAVFTMLSQNVEARRVLLRPLSAREVYRILKEAGRENAVPEGRIVTQGIAAITGFNLGLATGIGGSILFDLATANATTDFINNFNMTALTEMLSLGSTRNTSSSSITYQTQEICFTSRSMDLDEQERSMEYNANDGYGRQAGTSPTTTTTDTGADTTDDETLDTNTGVGSGTSADDGAESNTATNTQTDTGSARKQTCLVIQKPTVRKRRSSHRRRRH